MVDYALEMRGRWSHGDAVDISEAMTEIAMAIVATSLFRHNVAEDTKRVSQSLTVLVAYFSRLMSPFLKLSLRLPLPSTLRFRRACRELDEVLYRMIAERRRAGEEGDDLLGLLLRAKDDETNVFMSEKQLCDELVTLFIAGHETT